MTSNQRYTKFIDDFRRKNLDPSEIENAVSEAMANVNEGVRSFIIYGEPQSGKTNMMIALTSCLLDAGHNLVVILTQNITDLEKQTFERFLDSTLKPPPKYFSDVTSLDYPLSRLEKQKHIIFCRKDSNNMKALINKVSALPKVVIDDEADYASPDSKINKPNKPPSTINKYGDKLLGDNGQYIGVTATPARLDLNNTFDNVNTKWVNFAPHKRYKGRNYFFPIVPQQLEYQLDLLKEHSQDSKERDIRSAVFRFLVNASYLNIKNNDEINYLMLIHTDRKIVIHQDDRAIVEDIFDVLYDSSNKRYRSYMKEIGEIAERITPCPDEIIEFIGENIDNYSVGVVNSAPRAGAPIDYERFSEKPGSMFTIAIGGDKASRGITFNNLLSMFFSRHAKIPQQDTYVQRARMFGARGDYARRFNLTIPESLYKDWWQVFYYQAIAYNNLIAGDVKWASGVGFRAVAPSSIDKKNVTSTGGEMMSEKVLLTDNIKNVLNKIDEKDDKYKKLDQLSDINKHLIDQTFLKFLKDMKLDKKYDIAIHPIRFMKKPKDNSDINYEEITRKRGMIGGQDTKKFPAAKHHFLPVSNEKEIRMFYSCPKDKISYLVNTKYDKD